MRGPPSGHRKSGNLLLTSALAFLSFLGYFGSDASGRVGDALNTIFIFTMWCRMLSLDCISLRCSVLVVPRWYQTSCSWDCAVH